MGTCGLPDMFTLSLQALGVHIRWTTHAYATNTKINVSLIYYWLIPILVCYNCGMLTVYCDKRKMRHRHSPSYG